MVLKILSLDTSTEAYSVACGDCDNMNAVVEHFAVAPYKHSLLILEAIKKILAEYGLTLAQLDCIAFTHGPGSFTGLRLAASIVQGLAVAHDLPVVPVSTLQTIAQGAYSEHQAQHVLVGIDARMHEIYWGEYSVVADGYMSCIGEDVLINPNKVQLPNKDTSQTAKEIVGVGNAWDIYGTILQERSRVATILTEYRYPHARYVAMLAAKYYRAGTTIAAAAALPVYLRDKVAHVK